MVYSPSRSARTNFMHRRMGRMMTSIQNLAVLLCVQRVSRRLCNSSMDVMTSSGGGAGSGVRTGRNSSSVSITSARKFCGYFFPDNILGTPRNAAPSTSAQPLSVASPPMQPMMFVRKCIPPILAMKSLKSRGFSHLMWTATLKSCWSAV